MREPLEAGPVAGTQSREGFVGGSTDRDVVGMSEDAVGAERDDNGGILLVEDPRDRQDDVIERNLRDATVRQAKPLVTVRNAAECSPRGFILALANGPERFARCREPVSDVPLLAERGVDQDEPEVRVFGVQRDAARNSVRVVVRMREDAREGPVASRHGPKLSTEPRRLMLPDVGHDPVDDPLRSR